MYRDEIEMKFKSQTKIKWQDKVENDESFPTTYDEAEFEQQADTLSNGPRYLGKCGLK